jgi:hypothetical protein
MARPKAVSAGRRVLKALPCLLAFYLWSSWVRANINTSRSLHGRGFELVDTVMFSQFRGALQNTDVSRSTATNYPPCSHIAPVRVAVLPGTVRAAAATWGRC